MDIIDIIIAKAQANAIPVSIANLEKQAKQAVKDANDAVTAIDAIEDRAITAAETAEEAAASLEDIASTVDTKISTYDTETVAPMRADIDALQAAQITDYVSDFAASTSTTSTAVTTTITANRNGKTDVSQTFKNYQSKGQNTDGSMTQKAITTELNALAQAIEDIDTGGGGAIPTFPTDDAGKILMVGDDGSIVASSLTEESIINTQMATNTYMPDHTIGLTIDYVNKTCEYLACSAQPEELACYTGRRRCILNNNGQVVAYFGDINYIEDGSRGNVMVELPPVWYRRVILESAAAINNQGNFIKKEQILISDRPQHGFTLHPLFKAGIQDNPILAYVGAYEGAIINGTMQSIAGVQPTTNVSLQTAAESVHGGLNLSLTSIDFESYNQLLMLMEFGTLNIQDAFYPGVSKITNTGTTYCAAVLTGATSFLGNDSGEALSSTSVVNGVSTTYTESGKVSISYRGMENPYGNTWRYVNRSLMAQNNIITIGNNTYYLPKQEEWISGFNATSAPYFLPISTSISADSAYPVGDYTFLSKTGAADTFIAVGGAYNSDQQAGPFTYAINRTIDNSASIWRGFRLMSVDGGTR